MLSSWLNDFRLALRGLRASPLFTTVATLSLALGIGGNVAIFRLIDQLLLRQLPIRAPEELVMVYQRGTNMGSNSGSRMHSYPLYQDLQRKAEPLAQVLCRRLVPASVSVDSRTERVEAELVSGNYFTMLGVRPALGRVFNSKDDDQVQMGHPVVVLSHGYWMTRFAGDPGVIGKKIRVNDYPMTIVGVSAEGFAGLDPTTSPQIRVPVLMKPVMTPEMTWLKMENRRARWVQVFARLKPGYTVASARAPLQGLFTQIRAYETTLPEAKEWSAYQRAQFMKGTLHVADAALGYSALRNDFSSALVVLMAMVGLVLLIACANVANLLIARGVARQKEIAVRLSLGSSRGRLVRQLLAESLLLSALGAVLGLLLATGVTRTLLAMVASPDQSLLMSAAPDWRVLLFTCVVACVTALVFGLIPALRASGTDPWNALKDTTGAVSGTGRSMYVRKALVVAQVTLSFLLLAGAGLFVRSLHNLKATETGVAVENLLAFELAPSLSGYDDNRAVLFYKELHDRLRSAPGITSAAYAMMAILAGDEWDSSMGVEGYHEKDGEDMQAYLNGVSPGYFATMKVPLLAGRDFRPTDAREDPTVAIVNRRFAEHYFPGGQAIGKHIGFGGGPGTKLTIEIIGVVADSLYEGPREGIRRQVFIPNWGRFSTVFYLRTTNPSSVVASLVRAEVKRLDPGVPVYGIRTVEDQLDRTLLTDRLIAMLSAGFGLLAAVLAAIGLYGVLAFLVARRTKELGIRLALGAQPLRLGWLVLREVLLLVGVGLAVGLPAAYALSRYVASQLFKVRAHDPVTAAGTVLFLVVVAGLAALVPARRASRVDPIVALRSE